MRKFKVLFAGQRGSLFLSGVFGLILVSSTFSWAGQRARVDLQDSEIVAAVIAGQLEAVRGLLDRGAKPDTSKYQECLDLTVLRKSNTSSNSKKIKVFQVDSLLSLAARSGNAPIVKLLLARGADPKVEIEVDGRITAKDSALGDWNFLGTQCAYMGRYSGNTALRAAYHAAQGEIFEILYPLADMELEKRLAANIRDHQYLAALTALANQEPIRVGTFIIGLDF